MYCSGLSIVADFETFDTDPLIVVEPEPEPEPQEQLFALAEPDPGIPYLQNDPDPHMIRIRTMIRNCTAGWIIVWCSHMVMVPHKINLW